MRNKQTISWPARLLGCAIGAGGMWFALQFTSLAPDFHLVAPLSSVAGAIGLYMGPKIWEVVVGMI